MSNYPSSSGYGLTQNPQPGFAAPPSLPAGGHPSPGGQMNYLPPGQTAYPQHQQGSQPGFLSQGQMVQPPQGVAPPSYGNTNSYPTSTGGFLSPPTYGAPNCNLGGGGGLLGPNSGVSPQSAGAPNAYHPCSAPPNNYPQMANNPNAGPYAPSPYPPQGGFPY
ncbi:unnamed protein product [Hymenolepis diminuta]|uniref:Uncharacterized protein n=1 Tax=Hymenolepis diminuta TaxID=6216 RepID=A0A564YM49_HYMDI|nr:unnamed protein product [Hymenolepis diminuta]